MEIIREASGTTDTVVASAGIRLPSLGNVNFNSITRSVAADNAVSRPRMQISRTGSIFETNILKVAAYARVSTAQEEQEESYESQKEYYEAFIKSNSRWEFVAVYADRGLSGTESLHRPQFQQMLKDAKAGKINLILVKSISRFARNAVEVQKYLHELKHYNVEVRFDKEGLSSFDGNTEMVLNMMAMVAEQESRSISQNTKWALQKQAERGVRHIGSNRVLGYDEIDGQLVPNADAWIVKLIFEEYAKGRSANKIVSVLQMMGAKTMRGNEYFHPDTIRAMLKNEIYKGDRLIQKQAPRDMVTKKPDETIDYDSYYVEEHHEAIISPELWEKVQKSYERGHGAGVIEQTNSHFLLGRISCKECGNPYIRKTFARKNGRVAGWVCRDRVAGKKGHGCKNVIVKEDELFQMLEEAIGVPVTEENCVEIRQILIDHDAVKVEI